MTNGEVNHTVLEVSTDTSTKSTARAGYTRLGPTFAMDYRFVIDFSLYSH